MTAPISRLTIGRRFGNLRICATQPVLLLSVRTSKAESHPKSVAMLENVVGATVTITNSATRVVTKGNNKFNRRICFVCFPRTFDLKVERSAFVCILLPALFVRIQQPPTMNVVLNPGPVTQDVIVSAEVQLI